MIGKAEVFWPHKHFGFLKVTGTTGELFYHENSLAPLQPPPEKGTWVYYELGEFRGRPCAINVRPLTPADVLGGGAP